MTVSRSYKDVLVKTHKTLKWGVGGFRRSGQIMRLVQKVGAITLLDFGAGQGSLQKALATEPQLSVTNYDPGIPEYDELPQARFDVVVCSEVLEHIEPRFLDEALATIKDKALKGVYITVPHCLATEILSDGRNAHLTVRGQAWWVAKLQEVWPTIKHKTIHWAVSDGCARPHRTEFVWQITRN